MVYKIQDSLPRDYNITNINNSIGALLIGKIYYATVSDFLECISLKIIVYIRFG